MSCQTFDVIYRDSSFSIEPHFCRELGCFGTNPDHGYTLEEACEEIAQHLEMEANAFRNKTHWKVIDYLEKDNE